MGSKQGPTIFETPEKRDASELEINTASRSEKRDSTKFEEVYIKCEEDQERDHNRICQGVPFLVNKIKTEPITEEEIMNECNTEENLGPGTSRAFKLNLNNDAGSEGTHLIKHEKVYIKCEKDQQSGGLNYVFDKPEFIKLQEIKTESATSEHHLAHSNTKESDSERPNYLTVHLRRHKKTDDVLTCSQCGYQTLLEAVFRKHLLNKHPDNVYTFKYLDEDAMFKCDQCEYQTLRKSYFKKHQNQHKNIDEVDIFKCDQCNYKTVRKDRLRDHMILHKNPDEVEMLKCDHCEYKTPVRSNLKQHERRHTGPRTVPA